MIRPSPRLSPLCLLLLACLAPVRADPLGVALGRILDAPALKGGITGAIVCRADGGRVVFQRNADVRLIPASNRKLFTAAAALEGLGPRFTMTTRLCAQSQPDGAGTIHGDVYLRGGGDGLLSAADLDAMAQALAARGVKRVEGDVVGDGTLFTDGPYGFGWEWDDLSDEEFPQISALEAGEGDLGVHVSAGKAAGDPVAATLDPPTAFLPVVVSARTGPKGAINDCAVTRPWDKNVFVVSGTLPLGQTLTANVPVQDPARLAATLLAEALARHGIALTGRAVMGRTPADAAVTLAVHTTAPLSAYLARMTKPSDNLLAESLVRLLGASRGAGGSYEAGHAAETPIFRRLGVDTGAITLVDGCGVGRRNYVTARAVAQLLLGMRRQADWRIYYNALPIAGVDGTLKGRMKGTRAANNVHAKTGTLGAVRALSGYVTGRDGHPYVFSLLMNNFPGTARQAGAVQDAFVEYLAARG